MKVLKISTPIISKITFKGRAEDSYFSHMAREMYPIKADTFEAQNCKEIQEGEKPMDLRTDYIWTLKHLGIPEKKAENEFLTLLNSYDVDRSYHDLDHIENMLKNMEAYEDLVHERVKNRDIFKLAIYMHDLFNGFDGDVVKSADYGAKLLESSNKNNVKNQTELLKKLIYATSHTKDLSNASKEEKLISDLDMAVLASEPDEYADYASKVREEYSKYGDEEYAKGRIKVLEKFLEKEQIFYTPFFELNYETRARDNIKNEIDSLRGCKNV